LIFHVKKICRNAAGLNDQKLDIVMDSSWQLLAPEKRLERVTAVGFLINPSFKNGASLS